MPAPIPDLSRDQQWHHYQAPSGQRCGSPAMKGEYYCYHHLVKNNYKKNYRVLIDPEITRMEVPPTEDRASIFIALAAVVHRLAENTIDTRRAGQMIYSLQIALQALPPLPVQPRQTRPAAASRSESQPVADGSNKSCHPERAQRAEGPRETAPATTADTPPPPDPPSPVTIPITKESLLFFLRSRHCASCNAELFPASELTERPNAGAAPEIVEESRPALPAPEPQSAQAAIASASPTVTQLLSSRGETEGSASSCPTHPQPTSRHP